MPAVPGVVARIRANGHNRMRMSAASRSLRPAPFLAGLMLILAAACGVRAAPGRHDADKTKQTQAQAKLKAVKAQIAQLTANQRETADRRDKLNATLAAEAGKLDAAARAVHESDTAIADKRKQIDALEARRAPLQKHLEDQRQALAQLLRAAYALGRGSDLRLLLGDDDIARIGRALVYSRYFQQDRIKRIKGLLQDLEQLRQIEDAIAREQKALETERDDRRQRMQSLQAERDRQRALLARTRDRLTRQGRQLEQLKRNQQALNDLIARLGDVFADIPKTLPDDTPFARRRGRLPWPVRGRLSASGEGVAIDAPRGTAVRAVAHGRVAFANFLRGYGMLIIVDHGHGWMSLYGDNESLLHGVGDWVNAGESIGTAGVEAGGHEGVYFGLRHKGKPVDPKPWLRRHP